MSIKLPTGRNPDSDFHPEKPVGPSAAGKDLDLRVLAKFHEFFHAVTEPAPLAAMVVAGPAFSLVRNPVMSWLLSKPAGLWTRGLGLRMGAAAAGLPGEVAAFAATQRAVQHVLQPGTLDWSPEAVAREAGGLGLTLALFKMHGRVAQILLPKQLQAYRSAAAGAGMYSGIVHSHLWEERLGWREGMAWDQTLGESLVTFLQLKSMGHLTQRMMGPRYGAWVASLEARAEQEIQKSEDAGSQGTDFLGLSKIFQPHAVTTAGVHASLSRDFIVNMSGPRKGDGPPGGPGDPDFPSSPSFGRPTPISTPSSPLSELASDPGPFEAARLLSEVESAIKKFSNRTDPVSRLKGAQVLLAHEQTAAEALTRQFREKKLKETEIVQAVDRILTDVRQAHFQGINEKNLLMVDRLSYLVGELRRTHRRARGPERTELGTLLDSAELKQWEIARVYAEGEAILANFNPKKPNSEFSAAHYGEFRQHYEDSHRKIAEYLERNPQYERVLKNYRDPGADDTPLTLKSGDLHSLILHLDIPMEVRGFFQDALEFDQFLATDNFRPLYRTLRQLTGGLEPRVYLDNIQSLQEYLEALKGLRAWISRGHLKEIRVLKYLNSPDGEPQSLEALQKKLAEKIKQRMEEAKTETKREGDLNASTQAVEVYLEKLRGLLDLLHNQRSLEPYLPPLKWDEVKARLKDRVTKGMVHPNAADQILKWIEGSPDQPGDLILRQYRSEFLAGMLEFFFNENRTLEEQAELNYLLMEICDRQDILMMRTLAVRFHNYQRGMETRSGNSSKPKDENGGGRHEALRKALLEMAGTYQKYPDFRGPYFEILEKIHDSSQPHSLRLNAPIYLRIQNLLKSGEPVELLAHPSLGLEVLRIQRPGEAPRWEAITSIQENLDSKATFNKWMGKMALQMEQNHEDTYRVSLFIPRIRSERVRKEALTWARDFLEDHPSITEISLNVPTTAWGRAIKDHLDATQYANLLVGREISTTAGKMDIFRNEMARGSLDVGNHLTFYQMLRESDPLVIIESEAFNCLLNARRRFPENKTVAVEMWRVLEENYQMLKFLGHEQLSDFNPADVSRNSEQRILMELKARDPLQYNLVQLEREWETSEARWSGQRSFEEHARKAAEDISYKMQTARQAAAEGGSPPQKGLLKLIEQRDLTLGSMDHLHRVGLFFEAVLGVRFPNTDLKEVFDLSPLGYETKDWSFRYNPKEPHRFTLRGAIIPSETGKPPFSRPRNFLVEEGERRSGMEEGSLSLRIERNVRGEIRLVVQSMKPPMGHGGNGVGTLLVQKLISLGKALGAQTLVFRNVENVGKYALMKMGGRIDRNSWNLAKSIFPPFVDQKVQELGLLGVDTSAASAIRTAQEIAEAYLDPVKRTLTLHPRWDRREKTSDIFFVDPEAESPYQVGRRFFSEISVHDWEVTLDLRTGSPDQEQFWRYYRHRFDLGEGEVLGQTSKKNGSPEAPPQD